MAAKSSRVSAHKGFTFVPRELVASPKQFGRTRTAMDPARGVPRDDPRFQAAQLQHRLVKEVREFLSERGETVSWLASPEAGHPGVSVDRMHRMLRGETMLQVADLLLFTSLTKNGPEVVQDAIGVDRDEYVELEHSHSVLKWAMKDCTCKAGLRASDQLRLRRQR